MTVASPPHGVNRRRSTPWGGDAVETILGVCRPAWMELDCGVGGVVFRGRRLEAQTGDVWVSNRTIQEEEGGSKGATGYRFSLSQLWIVPGGRL